MIRLQIAQKFPYAIVWSSLTQKITRFKNTGGWWVLFFEPKPLGVAAAFLQALKVSLINSKSSS